MRLIASREGGRHHREHSARGDGTTRPLLEQALRSESPPPELQGYVTLE